jgi:hypothetical protein
MKPSCRGIFVTDLDGTLRQDGQIAQQDRAALTRLAGHNVLRVIATGRSLHSVRTCLEPDFPVDFLILSTGNQILNWKTGEVLFSSLLPDRAVREICHLLEELDLSFMVHDEFPDNHRFAFRRSGRRVEDFERRLALHAPLGRELDDCGAPASQVVAIVDAGQESLHEHLARKLHDLSVIRATSPLDGRSVWIEIFAAAVSKADGIRRIVEHHGLRGLPVAAIGNDHNDKDMLDLAHLAYRVGNSHLDPDARYIAAPDSNGAVAFAIGHYTDTLHSGMTHA